MVLAPLSVVAPAVAGFFAVAYVIQVGADDYKIFGGRQYKDSRFVQPDYVNATNELTFNKVGRFFCVYREFCKVAKRLLEKNPQQN